MTPQPKRKHSQARKGKRVLQRKRETVVPELVTCKHCNKKKLPHQQCKACGK